MKLIKNSINFATEALINEPIRKLSNLSGISYFFNTNKTQEKLENIYNKNLNSIQKETKNIYYQESHHEYNQIITKSSSDELNHSSIYNLQNTANSKNINPNASISSISLDLSINDHDLSFIDDIKKWFDTPEKDSYFELAKKNYINSFKTIGAGVFKIGCKIITTAGLLIPPTIYSISMLEKHTPYLISTLTAADKAEIKLFPFQSQVIKLLDLQAVKFLQKLSNKFPEYSLAVAASSGIMALGETCTILKEALCTTLSSSYYLTKGTAYLTLGCVKTLMSKDSLKKKENKADLKDFVIIDEDTSYDDASTKEEDSNFDINADILENLTNLDENQKSFQQDDSKSNQTQMQSQHQPQKQQEVIILDIAQNNLETIQNQEIEDKFCNDNEFFNIEDEDQFQEIEAKNQETEDKFCNTEGKIVTLQDEVYNELQKNILNPQQVELYNDSGIN